MDFEEWHYINIVKPKQDWARVSQQAKLKKFLNKKSKRDIEREIRIAKLGGSPIEIEYGKPLEEDLRQQRKELEWDLKYPKRKEKKVYVRKTEPKPKRTGAERTQDDVVTSMFKSARARSFKKGIPFNLEQEDLKLPDVCPVLGIELSWGDKITESTPSLDRLKPELGYVKGNCVIISMRANRLKNDATEEELESILRYMRDHK